MSGWVGYSSVGIGAVEDERFETVLSSASQTTINSVSTGAVEDERFETVLSFASQTTIKESEGVPYPDPSRSAVTTEKQGAIVPLLKPVIIFLVGALLALGHHFFNVYADGKSLHFMHVPQVWMSRIGTAFAFSFKSALATSLSFVLCQLMWLTLRRKFLTLAEIDKVYLTGDRDMFTTFFSSSITKSPLLVITAAISFLLPISTVLTPSSLRVVTCTFLELASPCQIPTGNLTNGGPGSMMYFDAHGIDGWTGITPVAQKLVYSTFVGQRIPTLPQPCGVNCTYSVSFPSFAFRCQEGVEFHAGQGAYGAWTTGNDTFWNATATTNSLTPDTPFYVYWKSNTENGTNGTALCSIGTAQYDFTIQITNGQQFVSYNVTQTGDLPPSVRTDGAELPDPEISYARQLASLSTATRSLLLGTLKIGFSGQMSLFYSPIIPAAFFNTSLNSGSDFSWGNVARGIEELSHNVSAAILTMELGVQDSRCAVSRQDIVYEYNRLNLWLPYGVALLIVSLCLILGIMVFLRLNPENLTSSFSDTVGITRNSSLNIFARNDDDVTDSKRRSLLFQFRLGELKNGGTGFGMGEDLKLE